MHILTIDRGRSALMRHSGGDCLGFFFFFYSLQMKSCNIKGREKRVLDLSSALLGFYEPSICLSAEQQGRLVYGCP